MMRDPNVVEVRHDLGAKEGRWGTCGNQSLNFEIKKLKKKGFLVASLLEIQRMSIQNVCRIQSIKGVQL